ncbi:MAG: hypothetical protein ACI8QP_000992 [Porticoccaceae bacterium]|jgi:hypothetical protein
MLITNPILDFKNIQYSINNISFDSHYILLQILSGK